MTAVAVAAASLGGHPESDGATSQQGRCDAGA